MAAEENGDKKEFIFTWIIENLSCSTFKNGTPLDSPPFQIDESDQTSCQLRLYPRGKNADNEDVGLYFRRNKSVRDISLCFKLQLLNVSGLPAVEAVQEHLFSETEGYGFASFITQNDLYFIKRNEILHNDRLIVRARIWETSGTFKNTSHCIARTRLHKEVISFLWTIENFSSLNSEMKKNVSSPTISDKNSKITLDLSLNGGPWSNESLGIEVTFEQDKYKLVIATFCLLNECDEEKETKQEEIWMDSISSGGTWKLPCLFSREQLIRNGCLRSDTIRIQAKFTVLKGVVYQEIESYVSGPLCEVDLNNFAKCTFVCSSDEKNEPVNNLSYDMNSMHLDKLLSDVTLQADSQNFAAHRAHLSARSPVFKAMFTTDMKESATETVQIKDIEGETLGRMLHFLYTDSVGDLQFDSAKKLYTAADMYDVVLLKKKCSEYLQKSLSITNVCSLLVLADQHHDDAFKSSVLEYVVRNYKEVLNTEDWRALLKSHVSLAAEAMYQKFLKSL